LGYPQLGGNHCRRWDPLLPIRNQLDWNGKYKIHGKTGLKIIGSAYPRKYPGFKQIPLVKLEETIHKI